MNDEQVAEATPPGEGEYTEKNVAVLRDAAHIRRRPGVYIGDVGPNGLHHLVFELVYNCVDEALAGYCKNMHVHLGIDGSVFVSDDGRGIPVEIHPEVGKPTLEVVLTVTGAGAKFDKRSYKTSAGLHGMGAKAVTALSEWVEAEVRRNGRVYVQEFERGKASTEIRDIGAAANRTGTRIKFKPDPEIFHERNFEWDRLETRLRELAFLNKGLAIKLSDERTNREEIFHYAGGLAEFVTWINREEEVLHPPFYLEKTVDDVRVEVALQYTTNEGERIRAYANNAYNPQGGTHVSGLRGAITRALNTYGQEAGAFKNVTPIGEDTRDGLTGVISVAVPEPQFESQTKVRLNNPEIDGIVTSVVHEALSRFLEENPKEAKKIVAKVALAAEAREAASKAKKAIRERKSILSGGGLPGKLMDCTTKDRDQSELFLVEGQSAGGSAEGGRNREFQAILPLRGKVLNVEKSRPEKFLENAEITSLISAIGVDIGIDADLEGLRYGKVVILTDADVDGQHIRTLLLTFFYRQMTKLVEQGHIYVARPPLFKVTQKKTTRFVSSKEEMSRELMDRGLSGTTLSVLPAAGSQPVVYRDAGLADLVKVLGPLEEALQILELRGLNLSAFLARATDRGLPSFRVALGSREEWCYTTEEVDKLRKAEQEKLGRELVVADEEGNGNGDGHAVTYAVHELHEVRGLNRGIEELRRHGLSSADLVPIPRIAGREPPTRFVLENGDQRRILPHLRELVGEVRKLGERGLTVTRFKGLGEMNADELGETTLDPGSRTLLQVRLDDAIEADKLFRILMGEKVEDRRNYIQTQALDLEEIDYHGA